MEFEHKVGAFDDEGLVAADKEKKDWKGIVISLLVIGSIMGAIIVAIFLLTPDGDVDSNKFKLDFEVVVSDQYKIQVFNGTWLSNHEIVYVDQNGSIVIFDALTNKSSSMLVKTYDKTLHTMGGFKLSRDRQSILFVSDQRHEFGAPVSARYAILNISSQTVEFLDDLIKINYPMTTPHIQYANWGPNSNSIIYIESNDIHFIPDFAQNSLNNNLFFADSTVAVSSNNNNNKNKQQFLRLTKTGATSNNSMIRNGLPDNLYRSNLFNQPDEAALWWSSDGRYLAYLSFDDSQVDSSPIEYYDSYLQDSNTSPKIHYEKYPRAGSIIPRVSVHIVDLSSGNTLAAPAASDSDADNQPTIETSIISPPAELIKQQQLDPRAGHYITYVGWLNQVTTTTDGNGGGGKNQLLVMWSNRAQSSSTLTVCENVNEKSGGGGDGGGASWNCETLSTFSQRVPPNIDAQRTILSSMDNNGTRLIFFALPRPDSVIGDHYHVAMLRANERAPKYLTHGEFDVDRLIAYDAPTDTLYFEVKISEKAERHLYKISSISQIANRQTACLTCNLPEPCGYNYVHIAPGCKYLVHECLGPSIPSTRLRLLAPELDDSDEMWSSSSLANNTKDDYTTEASGIISNQQQRQQQQQQQHSTPPTISRLTKLPNNSATATNSTSGTMLKQRPEHQKSSQQLLKSLNVLGVNSNIEALVKSKQMPIEKFIAIKSNQQLPCDIYMKLYLPNEIEEEKDKRFPLLIEASEIDQRNVWRKFDLDWGKYLSSKKQIIYAKMDCVRPRTGLSGGSSSMISPSSSLLFTGSSSSSSWDRSNNNSGGGGGTGVHLTDDDRKLNSPLFNAKDQVDAIKFIAENVDLFPFIDRRRIAIWGPSSTSAYVALATTINDDSKLIQCTIAVSPITNWRYMNAYAAEHYLGAPWIDSNSLKYERANLLKRSYEFALRKLLIVHGTADEQVHVQHSMQFIKSLTEHHITGGALHQMQLYPDVGHSLDQVKRHLFLTLDGFVDRCFYQKPIAIKATEWKGKVRPKLY